MADGCIEIVTMGDSSDDSDGKYEIYEAGSDMLCVIGLDNKQSSTRSPGLKPRYKQSYREAWESMKDFKGWLTSVPGNNTKAYCKLCKKELHCHRLSLLKHKVTFKHHKKEEEQKLIKLCEEKNESNSTKHVVEEKNEKLEGSSNESTVIEQESCKTDDENIIMAAKSLEPETDTATCPDKQEETQSKEGLLSTHLLDITKGTPAALVHIVLYKLIEGRWTLLQEGLTGSDGRYHYVVTEDNEFTVGRYKLHVDIDKYFEKQNQKTIFPFIEVAFDVKDTSSHYHIPLLLSPFGYSTYRGS